MSNSFYTYTQGSYIKTCMVWIDIETGGLDLTSQLLEVGIVVTDSELEVIDSESWVIRDRVNSERDIKDNFVRDMHRGSGLLADILDSQLSVQDAEDDIMDWIHDVLGTPSEVRAQEPIPSIFGPMCGSTIGFDRAFLKHHMPKLHNTFHYRNIDVSTLKELCALWNPEVAAHMPPKREVHRVLDDLDDTLTLMRFLRDNFLFVS